MTTFLAIDFETADNFPDSACAVGGVRVENGVIVQEFMRLIRPPRDAMMFTHIHGITFEHVRAAPHFGQIWPEFSALFIDVDFVVAHNFSFDKRVLEACCRRHELSLPEYRYECTVKHARKVLGIFPTKLSDVCRHLGLELNHHEALSDARACAQIMLRCLARPLEAPVVCS